jgi:hypothetical protein
MTLPRQLVALAALATTAATLNAQSVRGTVVDPGGNAIPGVVVQLLDSANAIRARALTDEAGAFLVIAPSAATYRIQTLRIGFRPVFSDPVALGEGAEITRRITVTGLPARLDTVRVGGLNPCRRVAGNTPDVVAVWEQVRASLSAADLSNSRARTFATRVNYQRRLDEFGWRTMYQTMDVRTDPMSLPWSAPTPESLHSLGYILVGSDSNSYRVPGMDAIASDAFVDDHCFRLTGGGSSDAIGIAFEPIPERRNVGDIRGTVIVDRKSSEVRSMEFRYQYADIPDLADGARGALEFARLKGGVWVITKWEVRMPVKEIRVRGSQGRVGFVGGAETRVVTSAVRVEGSRLSVAVSGADTLWSQPPIVLRGEIRDSISGRTIAGARVSLEGTGLSVAGDDRGRFEMRDVLPGEYIVDIKTPSLDSLGTSSQLQVSITEKPDQIRARVPNATMIATAVCGAERLRANGGRIPGILLGAVAVPNDSLLPPNTRVIAEWKNAQGSAMRADIKLEGERASFRYCDAPIGVPITLRASADSVRAEPFEVTLAPEKPMEQVQFSLDQFGGAMAELAGTVVDSTGAPVPGADVMVPELSRTTATDATGAFRLSDIPPGTHQVQVRKVGYGSLDAPLSFAASELVSRRIVLPRVTALNTVRIEATDRLMAEFEEHRKAGLGAFLTRDFLATQEGRPLSEIMGAIRGVRLFWEPALTSGKRSATYIATTRRCKGPTYGTMHLAGGDITGQMQWCDPCYALVFLDGMLLTRSDRFDINELSPRDIEAIEYFRSPAETPAKYNVLDSTCGVVVIHTLRKPKH